MGLSYWREIMRNLFNRKEAKEKILDDINKLSNAEKLQLYTKDNLMSFYP